MSHKNEKSDKRSFLRLVSPELIESRLLVNEVFQFGLFPEIDSSVMSFFHTAFLKRVSLFEVVRQASPVLVFDVRAVPSFRSFGLERKSALEFFEKHSVEYVDVSGFVGPKYLSEVTTGLVEDFICEYVGSRVLRGSAIFIFDNFRIMKELAETVPLTLRSQLNRNFQAHVFVGERVDRGRLEDSS